MTVLVPFKPVCLLLGLLTGLIFVGYIASSLLDSREPDYSIDVLETFEKFSPGVGKAYKFEYRTTPDMNHVEAAMLDFVVKLYPEVFAALENFCNRHAAYLDRTIFKFDREIQFYLAYLDHIQRFKKEGLQFCYPEVTDRSKEVDGRDVFDIALAALLDRERSPMVLDGL